MVGIYEACLGLLKAGEPIVIAGLFCLGLSLGFLLGKGARHTTKLIHRKIRKVNPLE